MKIRALALMILLSLTLCGCGTVTQQGTTDDNYVVNFSDREKSDLLNKAASIIKGELHEDVDVTHMKVDSNAIVKHYYFSNDCMYIQENLRMYRLQFNDTRTDFISVISYELEE